ncbi:hypothetical protein, partial [Salinisphaera sp. C84B14]|uniref:hypothetical protein n=1 Tax=Salinisphaera sp. C84B14 TaxID=1304155 RepID=UPI00333F57B2
EAVAIPSDSQAYEVIALRRVDDQLICVYPHATAGRRAHMKRVLTYSFLAWLIFGGISCALMFWGWYDVGPLKPLIVTLSSVAAALYLFLLFTGYMVGRRFRPCILIAEQTFRALGKTDFKSVDLQTSNYRLRRGGEPKSYGFQVFRLV